MTKFLLPVILIAFLGISCNTNRQDTGTPGPAIYSVPKNGSFQLFMEGAPPVIYIDLSDPAPVSTAAEIFAEDLERVTGTRGEIRATGKTSDLKQSPVIFGTIGNSFLIDLLIEQGKLDVSPIPGKWESYVLAVIDEPFTGIEDALVIAGSDPRGTAFGIFSLSEMIGVSPWYWWADVPVVKKDKLYLSKGIFIQGPPSVKYRGIFLNDEDWGLQPWAAQNMDPDIRDIGPDTYAKIFELLLRLKANFIWPAMHPSTGAFFRYPGNVKMAKDYGIVIGTSHAEPMLRNNVDEWDEEKMGAFNYITNKESVLEYWEKRVGESAGMDAIYTVGMRGVHDSRMEGVGSAEEAGDLLEQVITDQRGLLSKYVDKNASEVPQAFTVYKEVLDIYDRGMELPDDITIVWPDDNYGYIRRLSNNEEQGRSGGSGVYYHASYWGRPHDYLWLSTTHPALIREEMLKAFEMKADRIWVLNVGDLKPLEYQVELFLDMAYDTEQFREERGASIHLQNWLSNIFGGENGREFTDILWEYYDLAFERRPEFMGWSRTEPTTGIRHTAYNHFYFGDEAQRRIDAYDELEVRVKEYRTITGEEYADAFYQLVYYPVLMASLMNKKFLYRDKNILYANQNRLSANYYADLSKRSYEDIARETKYYNTELANGKWKSIMSMKPRNLPVFNLPELVEVHPDESGNWGISPEGYDPAETIGLDTLYEFPVFYPYGDNSCFVDIYLTGTKSISWTASASEKWVHLSSDRGKLEPEPGTNQERIVVSVDWDKAGKSGNRNAFVDIVSGKDTLRILVNTLDTGNSPVKEQQVFMEDRGYVSIFAENFTKNVDGGAGKWVLNEELGHTGSSMLAMTDDHPSTGSNYEAENSAFLEYEFTSYTPADAVVYVYSLPTHPLNTTFSLRYGISVDDSPVDTVDFRTYGRSEEWKRNVLGNTAARKISAGALEPGQHVLRIYMIDPGVILDRILVDLGGLKNSYSVIPETKWSKSKSREQE